MVNDINGDGYNYDAIYIPTDEEVANRQFRFVTEGDKNRFMDYVRANSYLKNKQGSTQSRIACTHLGCIGSISATSMISW